MNAHRFIIIHRKQNLVLEKAVRPSRPLFHKNSELEIFKISLFGDWRGFGSTQDKLNKTTTTELRRRNIDLF